MYADILKCTVVYARPEKTQQEHKKSNVCTITCIVQAPAPSSSPRIRHQSSLLHKRGVHTVLAYEMPQKQLAWHTRSHAAEKVNELQDRAKVHRGKHTQIMLRPCAQTQIR